MAPGPTDRQLGEIMDFAADAQVKALDPVFAQMNAATHRKLWDEIPELTVREKILLCVVADVCQQTLGLPFERHVRTAYQHGVSADDLRELIRFISFGSGYPAALAALARLVDIEREHGLAGPTGEGHQVNVDGTGSTVPASMRQALRNLDAPLADYFDLQSGMRAGMRLLSVRERAFTVMAVDVLLQTLDESFHTHVGRALAAGATPDEVRAVVRFTALFGLTKAWRGLRALNALFTGTGTVFGES